eukprot:1125511-Rhodomonas_salina.2
MILAWDSVYGGIRPSPSQACDRTQLVTVHGDLPGWESLIGWRGFAPVTARYKVICTEGQKYRCTDHGLGHKSCPYARHR